MTTLAPLTFLSLLLRGDVRAAAEAIDRGDFAVEDVANLIRANGLKLHMLPVIEASPLADRLPASFVEELRSFRSASRKRQEALIDGLIALARELEAGGHEFILLKGPYVAERFFGGIDRRMFWDIDVLVRREAAPAVERLLLAQGFTRRSGGLLGMTVTRRFVHALDFDRPGLALDLHWLLSLHPSLRIDYDAIWRDRGRFELRGASFFVLSDEYEVLTRLLEIVRDFERGATRLKLFADLYFVLSAIEASFDWDGFFERRRREHAARVSAHALALFLDLFDFGAHFPRLAAATARELAVSGGRRHPNPQSLLEPSFGAYRNKVWVSGLYECSRSSYGAWWLGTLPFRLSVYKRRRKPGASRPGRSSGKPA
jgi:hypothetical protein